MGLYTSIYLSPQNSLWTAPSSFVADVATLLEVSYFDFFTIERRLPFWRRPFTDINDHFEEIEAHQKVPIEEALPKQRVDRRFRTHMMFPYKDFMKRLMNEVKSEIPDKQGYIPWDTSIYNGFWDTLSYTTGKTEHTGSFAFVLHAGGAPEDLSSYLKRFLEVPGISTLKAHFEEASGSKWKACISMS
jgi:hypothetical protein